MSKLIVGGGSAEDEARGKEAFTEMAEALEEVMDLVVDDWSLSDDAWHKWYSKARAALAKAKGEDDG